MACQSINKPSSTSNTLRSYVWPHLRAILWMPLQYHPCHQACPGDHFWPSQSLLLGEKPVSLGHQWGLALMGAFNLCRIYFPEARFLSLVIASPSFLRIYILSEPISPVVRLSHCCAAHPVKYTQKWSSPGWGYPISNLRLQHQL